ncbi:MAG: aspartate aminotransferase family protein [Microbacteriaceae bacterium]|nr:aspartate aminotransferase family protein [Microbacteriaceae bacterium]
MPSSAAKMHSSSPATKALRDQVLKYARERMELDPAPLDGPQTLKYLQEHASGTISETGLGGTKALKVFEEVLAPACISTDHPGYLSFIPTAPTEAATLFDLVVSATSVYGGSWLEGSGAVFAENEVLAWLAKEVGLPKSSGGVFVQGGSLGNLSALVTARHTAIQERKKNKKKMPKRWSIIASKESHSSLKAAARVMDIDVITADVDAEGRLRGKAVLAAAKKAGKGLFAVVATAGTTNFGIVDRLDEVGKAAKELGVWYHIDGAYGLAGILDENSKKLFKGSKYADSFIVDPHKWLFTPFDCCALVYRNPKLASAAHTQHGEYLDTLTDGGEFNPSDYAYNLTRRARGLPLWFSLATYGVAAYRKAVADNINVAHKIAEVIRKREDLKLVREPELSIVVFEKKGWQLADYEAWSDRILKQGLGFVTPSSHLGKPNARFAIVNPRTDVKLLTQIIDSMDQK